MTSTPTARVHSGGGFHWVGDGFPVRSVFSYNDLGQELSPFLLLDYASPYKFEPGKAKRGVGEHPHRGFETVTIVYQGQLEHRDSSGGGGLIGPGDVQWMTAGSGLVHEEFHSKKFTEEGGMFEVAQLWVNLPAKDKGAKPGYQTLLKESIPTIELENGAGQVRVIAGEYNQNRGPAKTFSEINLWDMTLISKKSSELPLVPGHTKAILILRGNVEIAGQAAKDGDLVVVNEEVGSVVVNSLTDSKLLVMTGQPLGEPIAGYGPFVMNTQAEIKQAFTDYQMGKYGTFQSH